MNEINTSKTTKSTKARTKSNSRKLPKRTVKLGTLEVKTITFTEGFDNYINECRVRNLREASIKHNISGFIAITKYIPKETLIEDINKQTYEGMIKDMKKDGISGATLYIYCADFRKIINWFIAENYLLPFKITMPKVDKIPKQTYSDEELEKLLKKPNIKKCLFTEYKVWVLENFLLSTGLRLSSFINIKIKDVDLYNNVVNVTHTKNRKALIVPLNKSIVTILKEYLRYRHYKSKEDYLFCNVYGEKLTKPCITNEITRYNAKRGCSRGIHKFRHTFAKQWVLNGGSITSLSKILGHSNLEITSNYVNLLVSDVQKEVEEIDILNKFSKDHIKLGK